MQTEVDFAQRELCVVCEKGNLKRVKELLEYPGIDVNLELDGRTYVNRAATFGQYMVVKVLTQAGGRATRQDLVVAVASGSRHTANYVRDSLLDQDMDPMEFSWGAVLAQRSFMEALTGELAQWLVDHGVDVRETDNYGRNMLAQAELNGSDEVVAVFREAMSRPQDDDTAP